MTKEIQQQEKNIEEKVTEKKVAEDKVVEKKVTENKVAENKVAENKNDSAKTTQKQSPISKKVFQSVGKSVYGQNKNKQRRDRRNRNEKKDEFEQRILDIARVTRVMAGGKRMNFRACVGIGDKKGKVAVGLGKGSDVSIAVNKAVNKAFEMLQKEILKN
jgi:Rps23 Pro-64 3,4-dihydroxylase Tpa1-like proline 4-hydroxylase